MPSQKPRSVFEYLSKKDRERLENIASGGAPPTKHIDVVASATAQPVINIPTIDSSVAQAALHGFQPFNTDPIKHSRYMAYIRSQAYSSTSPDYTPPPALKPGQAIDDFNKEMEDYAKAALIFKPMSGVMAIRFTSASIIDTGPTIQEGLHQPAASQSFLSVPSKDDAKADVQTKETPKQSAARLGMYGALTREVSEWTPGRLLCKRFGVRNPRPDVEVPNSDDSMSVASAPAMPPRSTTSSSAWDPASIVLSSQSASAPPSVPSNSGPKDLANIGLGEDDDQGRDTLTYERPSMDIFKAIFASDDEDSDEDSDEGKKAIPDAIFVSKAKREGKSKMTYNDGDDVGKKPKKSRKSAALKTLLSFDMDIDGEALIVVPDVKKETEKKKTKRPRDGLGSSHETDRGAKRSKDEKASNEDEEGEWVEKAPILPLQGAGPTLFDNPMGTDSGREINRGRMRASDFL